MKSGRCLRTTVILAGLAAASLFASCMRWPHTHPRMQSDESAAIAALRAYLCAQDTFQRVDRYGKGKLVYANPKDGTGFPDLYRIGGPLEKRSVDGFRFIDFAFARATSPETPKAGYCFIDIVTDRKTGSYDFTKDCGLCAVPVVHGETGIHTFIINAEGTVYRKDNGGKPVTVFPDVESDGWLPVGS